MSPPDAAHRTGIRDGGNVNIYIDNSNLWIQGQRTYAEKHNQLVEWDPTWRFDVGHLKRILTENSGLPADEEPVKVKVNLYGSTPPPVDTVWRVIESHNVNVSTFARSSWTGREKEVDAEIIADSVEDASDAYHCKIPSEFVIVSGDRDLHRAVLKIAKKGFQVHVWSWKNALASVYTQQQQEALVKVHLLDDYLEEIGFRETKFRVDRSLINPASIVVLDPLPKADEVNELVSRLRIPVYRYTATHQGALKQDLVIIPAVKLKPEEQDDLFQVAKKRLEAYGLTVLSYLEYSQNHIANSKAELTVSNRFKEFEVEGGNESDTAVGHDVDDNHTEIDDNDGFTEVNRHFEKQTARLKKNELKLRRHCDWRRYCKKELDCKWGHTKEEEEHFKAYGHKSAKKFKICRHKDCTQGTRCYFAHEEAELFCPTCETTGKHEMKDCPQSSRNQMRK